MILRIIGIALCLLTVCHLGYASRQAEKETEVLEVPRLFEPVLKLPQFLLDSQDEQTAFNYDSKKAQIYTFLGWRENVNCLRNPITEACWALGKLAEKRERFPQILEDLKKSRAPAELITIFEGLDNWFVYYPPNPSHRIFSIGHHVISEARHKIGLTPVFKIPFEQEVIIFLGIAPSLMKDFSIFYEHGSSVYSEQDAWAALSQQDRIKNMFQFYREENPDKLFELDYVSRFVANHVVFTDEQVFLKQKDSPITFHLLLHGIPAFAPGELVTVFVPGLDEFWPVDDVFAALFGFYGQRARGRESQLSLSENFDKLRLFVDHMTYHQNKRLLRNWENVSSTLPLNRYIRLFESAPEKSN